MVLPPDLSTTAATGLIGLSFLTSLITAMFSLGGGSLLVSALALVLPATVVIPVHGCVQLGSNVGRALLQRAHIQWKLILWIVLGAAVGSLAGGPLAYVLPERWLSAAIGAFVLVSAWLPAPGAIVDSRSLQFLGGAIVSALGMVVGAAGPLIAAFLRGLPDRHQLIATQSTLVSFQHLFKVLVFMALGFAFSHYLGLILLMVISGFAGTALGSRLLTHVPEAAFRIGFKLLLSVVAVGLIWHARPSGSH
jgi:uncharacterized membrane protein YfcA